MPDYERNRVHVDQCTGCGGLFLDRGELEALVAAENAWHGPQQGQSGPGIQDQGAPPRPAPGPQPYSGQPQPYAQQPGYPQQQPGYAPQPGYGQPPVQPYGAAPYYAPLQGAPLFAQQGLRLRSQTQAQLPVGPFDD